MQLPHFRRADALLLVSLLLSAPTRVASMLDCEHIRIDGQDFNLGKLGGPHSVVTTLREPPSYSNTSYTVDICSPLQRKGDVPKEQRCPGGTRVCAIERTYSDGGDSDLLRKVIPIAGSLLDHGGFAFDYEASRLKTSDSNSDSQKEGVRLVLKGGAYPLDGPASKKTKQRAIIEFICDEELEGTEGEWKPQDEYVNNVDGDDKNGGDKDGGDKDGDKDGGDKAGAERTTRRAGEDTEVADQVGVLRDGEEQLVHEGAALKFISYGKEKDSDVETLRLEWRTKYACEAAYEDQRSAHWGFFTWLVIISFMGIAAYLIFGSWLNYTRYGARGWDLVPHGDAIRDIPYFMRDWTRSVLNSVQGSGTRGGYSAV